MIRLYCSRAREYPVGGAKGVGRDVAADWVWAAVRTQQPFFGETVADVWRIFGDADLITSLGCGSIINAPVILDGQTIGVLNILDAEGAYDEWSVQRVMAIAERSAEAVHPPLAGSAAEVEDD